MHSSKTHSTLRTFGAAAPFLCLCAVILSAGCSSSSDNSSPPPPPTKTTYTGTLYMASEAGGHIAVVPVTIDPSNATTPIVVDVAHETRIQLTEANGTPAGFGAGNTTHVFHDVRLDGTKLYYSTIFPDSSGANPGMAHLGYVDLASNNAVHDAMIDGTGAGTGMVYCGSGQTATHYFPMSMSSPAYVDAIAKSAIVTGATLSSSGANVKRTMIEAFRAGGDANYLFAHGVNSPDTTKLYVAVNETSGGAMTGAITSYVMNTSDVVAGTVSSSNVTSHTVSGLTSGGGTIAFRSTYTPDGTKILQAGSDRFLVLRASDLTVLDNNPNIGGSFKAFTGHGGLQNHDAMPTPDGKYAILSLRFQHASGEQEDSGIQLYDLANKTAIGDPVSTCNKCHDSATVAHPTCGLVGNLTAVTQ